MGVRGNIPSHDRENKINHNFDSEPSVTKTKGLGKLAGMLQLACGNVSRLILSGLAKSVNSCFSLVESIFLGKGHVIESQTSKESEAKKRSFRQIKSVAQKPVAQKPESRQSQKVLPATDSNNNVATRKSTATQPDDVFLGKPVGELFEGVQNKWISLEAELAQVEGEKENLLSQVGDLQQQLRSMKHTHQIDKQREERVLAECRTRLTQENSRLRVETKSLQGHLRELVDANSQLKRDNNALQSRTEAVLRPVGRSETEFTNLLKEKLDLQDTVEKITASKEKQDVVISKATASLQEVLAEKQTLQEKYKLALLDVELLEFNLKHEREQLAAQPLPSPISCDDMEKIQSTFGGLVQELETETKTQKQEIAYLRERVAIQEQSLEAQMQLKGQWRQNNEALTSQLEALRAGKVQKLEEDQVAAQKAVMQVKSALDEKLANIASLEKQISQFDQEAEALRTSLSEAKEQGQQQELQLVQLREQLAEKDETVAGLQDMLQQTSAELTVLQEELRDAKEQLANPPGSDPALLQEMYSSLGEDEEIGSNRRMPSLLSSMSGGRSLLQRHAQQGAEDAAARIAELEELVFTLQREIEGAQATHARAQKAQERLTAVKAMEELSTQKDLLKDELVLVEQQKAALESKSQTLSKQLSTLKSEKQIQEQRFVDIEENLQARIKQKEAAQLQTQKKIEELELLVQKQAGIIEEDQVTVKEAVHAQKEQATKLAQEFEAEKTQLKDRIGQLEETSAAYLQERKTVALALELAFKHLSEEQQRAIMQQAVQSTEVLL